MATTEHLGDTDTPKAASLAGGWKALLGSAATAVSAIWVATAFIAIFAPDMVTGSEQEHLPMAAMTVWLWASVATAYTVLATGRIPATPGLVLAVVVLWTVVAVASIAAPEMVTGSDPTRIPITVFIAPVVGAVTTGFLALQHAGRAAG